MKTITEEELKNINAWKSYKPLLDILSKNKVINYKLILNSPIQEFEKFEIINDLKLLNDTERQKIKNYLIEKFNSRIQTYPSTIESFELSLQNDNLSNLSATVVYSFGKDHSDTMGRAIARKNLLSFIESIAE